MRTSVALFGHDLCRCLGLAALLAFGLFLSSCGQQDQQNIYKTQKALYLDIIEPLPGLGYVNKEFRKYVSRFESISGRKVMDRIVLNFGKTDPDEAASCTTSYLGNFGMPEIIMSRSHWEEYSADHERELIVFHELGHCVLGRDHRGSWGGILSFNLNSQVCAPLSIMYPEADWSLMATYQTHRDYYIKELTGKKPDQDRFEIVDGACDYYELNSGVTRF